MLTESIKRNPTAVLAYQALPATLDELIAKTGMARSTVRYAISRLQIEGLAHIASYKLCKNSQKPIFAAGISRNAQKIPAKALAEIRNRRYRMKN
jgi:DNA-binding transcriptional regulator GbsR (MarR family)